ncbi:MAG: lysophospholipid acyltransferase family protein [Alphaproteobacteria bacterium]|nr:lysophospholipid acyltransferase family protein [Alphaproteobacteria bacterium]
MPFLSRAAAAYIRLVFATTRWEVMGRENVDGLASNGLPAIYTFWHGRLLMMPCFAPQFTRMHVMISLHRDGEFIARTMRHFGFGLVRGSSSRDGGKAVRDSIKLLKKGENISITPDGPRGPRMHAQMGAVILARITGTPILPVTCSGSQGRLLKSWDRFFLLYPFGRAVLAYGPPVLVPLEATPEQCEAARQKLEESLNTLTAECDRKCGREPVLPA